METLLRQFATTAADTEGTSDILSGLGIDGMMLLMQAIAFLLLVWALKRFVYPIFLKVIDERQAKIEESTKAADEAKKAADNASTEVAELLAEARKEAADIVATAKTEATSMIDAAEAKSKTKAEAILSSARDDINKEVAAARDALHNDMIDLVAQATEKVVGAHISADIDAKLIKQSVKEGGR